MPQARLEPGFGLSFTDLYNSEGLVRLDAAFLDYLTARDPQVQQRLIDARKDPESLDEKALSTLLVDAAPFIEDFIAELFHIRTEIAALEARHNRLAPLYSCRRLFVQRQVGKGRDPAAAAQLDGDELSAGLASLLGRSVDDPFDELQFAEQVLAWMDAADKHADDLGLARDYTAWVLYTEAGRARHQGSCLFVLPAKLDMLKLVPVEVETPDGAAILTGPGQRRRFRDGFGLTDQGMGLRAALAEAHYCIWCHNQARDSCAKGLKDRKSGAFKDNALGVSLIGCPLEEKISEMNLLKSQGKAIAALAMVTLDNPLCAATGHRICNDCMKACIYQKQQPVDIPQIESRALKDVLELPWGFEIYSLLSRWSPLDFRRPVPRPGTGAKVLVVGMGPAGFNLAHHLINDGHTVVGIDGLKIEPLDAHLSGVCTDGESREFEPIRDIKTIREDLDERTMAGFGGVAEYGITVRWDKNNLKYIRLLLERRERFALYGGVRFGSTLTIDDALALGFDHIALCAGAGKPTLVPIPNALARGVKTASDFLMALQLTGAAKRDSLANLQVRLPALIIGGGLTAIDTATEVLAYYPLQVEKFLHRFESLSTERGEAAVRAAWSDEEAEIAEEFIAHARAIREHRAAMSAAGRAPRIQDLLRAWGGATIVYRRRMIHAPSYTGNHEEVNLALEEGIGFAECLTPVAIDTDSENRATAMRFARREVAEDGTMGETVEELSLPARAIFFAAGTQPNTVLRRESGDQLDPLDGKYFQAFDESGQAIHPQRSAKPESTDVLMKIFDDGREMSFWGDLHPSFAGNVVKAMGGTRLGYPVISRRLAQRPLSEVDGQALIDKLNHELRPRIREVVRLTPTIVEVVIEAPVQARAFHPGQFYRLQNYETLAAKVGDSRAAMEGLALTGARRDARQGLISTIVLEMGGSSDLCATLKPGEPVVLMGPTGSPTATPGGETVLLVGGGLGNAVLFSIGRALREAGSRVIYAAGYKAMQDRYHVASIEAAADQVIWCCDEAPGFVPGRPQDCSFTGNIVAAMVAFAEGRLGRQHIPLAEADRILCIGSDRMMAAVCAARHGVLKPHLKPGHLAIGSINSPMQCMMKEICAQCIQRHVDPDSGEERVVYSCFNQDQPLDQVDFTCLNTRLAQNTVQEKLTRLWVQNMLLSMTDTSIDPRQASF